MSSFSRLRSRLPPAESAFYEFLWAHFLTHKAWPSKWHVYREHCEKPKLAKVLTAARYTLHSEITSVHPHAFELQLTGVLVTGRGETYRRWLVSLFAYLRDQFYAGENGQKIFTQAEAQRALNLSDQEADELGQVIRGGFLGMHPVWQPDSPGWQTYLPCHSLEDFPRRGSLTREMNSAFDRLLMQSKRSRKLRTARLSAATAGFFPEFGYENEADKSRRYQVFVSSTFDDLKEERQQVMQALLEMQCFPAGMELFPATNDAQWKLIKSVIDESDYYIVIVAARYGTLVPGSTISYTEREFDHAKRVGKPIFAFYHGAPGKIIGDKTDESRAAKRRRERFVEKIKTNRLCRSWSTAHELGSAVKSALQQAFKDGPRAGWTRAS